VIGGFSARLFSPRDENNKGEKAMKTVTCAQDLPRYGSVDIQASDDATALTAAKAFWDRVQKGEENSPVYDADWCGTVCNRIVEITDADFNQVAADVPLDAYRLE